MSNKMMLILGAVIAVVLGGYYVYEQKTKSAQDTTATQQPQTSSPTDPYTNYNAPSKP